MGGVIRSARIRQIRFCSRWLRRLSNRRGVFPVIRAIRELPLVRELLTAVLGYSRPFANLTAAAAAASGYEGGGHYNPNYLKVKIPEAETVRPGDYAALFYIQQFMPHIRSVFDLGGNVGNLFYCYVKYLNFGRDFRWTVLDLPKTIALGRQIATGQNENRLFFTDRLNDADGTNLFMTSGSLQFFEQSLPSMIAGFVNRPPFVLVNREPLTDGPTTATVVDGETYRLPAMLHNRNSIIQGMVALGYEMLGSWQIPERSLIVPCYPDRSALEYSGMFFRLTRVEAD
jgi:putative methyltransferase (TIGR04325 family)